MTVGWKWLSKKKRQRAGEKWRKEELAVECVRGQTSDLYKTTRIAFICSQLNYFNQYIQRIVKEFAEIKRQPPNCILPPNITTQIVIVSNNLKYPEFIGSNKTMTGTSV